jgi:ABC-type polysaccharide/polyol phosphate transport system ATPase subunit
MGVPRFEILLKYDDLVEFADLGEFIELLAKTHSAGMARRLAFAIATGSPADILSMAERLGVGDVHFRKEAAERMGSLTHLSGILVLTSSALETLKKPCNRRHWLKRGR